MKFTERRLTYEGQPRRTAWSVVWAPLRLMILSMPIWTVAGGFVLLIAARQYDTNATTLDFDFILGISFVLALAAGVAYLVVLVLEEGWRQSAWCIVAAVGAGFFAFSAIWLLNGLLDDEPPQRHEVSVVTVFDRSTTGRSRGKGNRPIIPRYYAHVSPWQDRGRRAPLEILIPGTAYQGLVKNPSLRLAVLTRPGRFGIERVIGVEVIEESTNGIPARFVR